MVELCTIDASELDPALVTRLAAVIPHFPDIVDVEFHHAVRELLLGDKISTERAEHARALFMETPKELGAYDACFIALAESLEAPLVTCDEKQANASGHRARVEAFT